MNNNNYPQQKLRGMKRKYEAVQARGGKCERCGYSANLAALDFHHRNPLTKEFQIDMRVFSNTSLDKCELLCANCHREHHYPDYGISRRVIQRIRAKDSNQEVVGSSPAGPTQLIVESNE